MININLIAERRARHLSEMTTLRVSILAVALLAVCMIVLNGTFLGIQMGMLLHKSDAQSQLDALRTDEERFNQVNAEIKPLKRMVGYLQQVRVSEDAWMTIMADISRTVPPEMSLTSLNGTAAKEGVALRITGYAKDESTVGAFMKTISVQAGWADTPVLNSVTKDASPQAARPGVTFDLSIPVRDLYGGEL